MAQLIPEALRTVCLFGEHDFPDVEVDSHESVHPEQLPISDESLALVASWLTAASLASGCSQEERLVAGVRAARAIALDLPRHVRVNFSMRLLQRLNDDTLGEWVSLDVDRD